MCTISNGRLVPFRQAIRVHRAPRDTVSDKSGGVGHHQTRSRRQQALVNTARQVPSLWHIAVRRDCAERIDHSGDGPKQSEQRRKKASVASTPRNRFSRHTDGPGSRA